MIYIMDWLEKELLLPSSLQIKIATTLFIILIVNILYKLLRRVFHSLIKDIRLYYKTTKTTLYIISITAFILIGRVWLQRIQSFSGFIGVFSAALAIVMKDVILNIAGWIYIVLKSPFDVGDRIEVDGVSGDVVDIQLFTFSLMEIRNWIDGDKNTGRIVYIPNVVIFNKALFNYNKEMPYVWDEITISIPFKSNWRKAKAILNGIVEEYSETISQEQEDSIKDSLKKLSLFNSDLKPSVNTKIDTELAEITFIMRYMSYYQNRRGNAEKIYESILDEFMIHDDIEFAYPVRFVYTEAKND